MTDPIADMLTRIRNAINADHETVLIPASKMKAGVCKVLKDEGYIAGFKIVMKSQSDIKIKVKLKPNAIVGIQRFSKPGLRQYRGYKEIPRVISGLGTAVLSTSKGVISDRQAKSLKVGGEILCNVW
ncbi:MAG: 30S ribosomal protein S8 [Bacteriovoracaceae bacterium]